MKRLFKIFFFSLSFILPAGTVDLLAAKSAEEQVADALKTIETILTDDEIRIEDEEVSKLLDLLSSYASYLQDKKAIEISLDNLVRDSIDFNTKNDVSYYSIPGYMPPRELAKIEDSVLNIRNERIYNKKIQLSDSLLIIIDDKYAPPEINFDSITDYLSLMRANQRIDSLKKVNEIAKQEAIQLHIDSIYDEQNRSHNRKEFAKTKRNIIRQNNALKEAYYEEVLASKQRQLDSSITVLRYYVETLPTPIQVQQLGRDTLQLNVGGNRNRALRVWAKTPGNDSVNVLVNSVDNKTIEIEIMEAVDVARLNQLETITQTENIVDDFSPFATSYTVHEIPKFFEEYTLGLYTSQAKSWGKGAADKFNFRYDLKAVWNYKYKKHQWNSWARWQVDFAWQQFEPKVGIGTDRLELHSKYSLTNRWRNIFFSGGLDAYTSVFTIFPYPFPEPKSEEEAADFTVEPNRAFLSPLDFKLFVGPEWKKGPFSLIITPVGVVFTHVANDKLIDVKRFGIEEGKKLKGTFGPILKASVKNLKITNKITNNSQLDITSYYPGGKKHNNIRLVTGFKMNLANNITLAFNLDMAYDNTVESIIYKKDVVNEFTGKKGWVKTDEKKAIWRTNENFSLGIQFIL